MRRAGPVTGLLRLPGPWTPVERRRQHGAVSGLPLRGLRSCRPTAKVCHVQEPLGLPTCCTASFPAGRGLQTPADLHRLALTVVRVGPAGACKPSAAAPSLCEAVPALQGRGPPCGLQEARSTLRPSCSPRVQPRLRHGRKTPYGWLALP